MLEKRLLTEWQSFEYDTKMVTESKEKNGGKIVLRGILQKSDTLNQNGRVYPRALLEREVRNYQKFINERRALGELDHPDTTVVELQNVSHVVTEARMEGDVVYGTIEVLSTPKGKILQSLIESNITIGISSRGVGSTTRNEGKQVVNDDFQLICWDTVAEPSTPGAFMSEGRVLSRDELKLFEESKEFNSKIDQAVNEILGYRR